MFGFNRKSFSGHKKPRRVTSYKPQCEALEKRELMSVLTGIVAPRPGLIADPYVPPPPTAAGLALINGLPDTPVRTTALADYQRDGILTRNDMIDIFFQGTTGFTDLTNSEFTSLQTLVNNGPTTAMPDYVQNLATKVLTGVYSSGLSPAKTIQQNVNNFFLGEMHPDDGTNGYIQVNKPLWNNYRPRPQDVHQTLYSQDNWLLTSLEETAWRFSGDIQSMFVGNGSNGDNTYTIRFFHGNTPDYVTVDNFLPNTGNEAFGESGVMWVGLVVKAYAQENAAGWLGSLKPGVNSYAALGLLGDGHSGDAGDPSWAFSAISGQSQGAATSNNVDYVPIYQAWESGHLVVLKTLDNANLVGDTGADPLFYPECGTDSNCGGYLPHPRWYALVNYTTDKYGYGFVTVTENGTRFLQMYEGDLPAEFDRWAETTQSRSWSSHAISAADAPPVPTAILVHGSPTGPTTDSRPTFTWSALDGADHYDLWVNDITTGQSQVIRNRNVTGTSFTPAFNLLVGHSYQWWVRGLAADGTGGPWSQALSFSVTPLPAPTLVGLGGEITNPLPTFAWSPVAGADHYDLWVDNTTAATSQVIRNQNVTGTSFTATSPMAVGHSYNWWVRAVTSRDTGGLWSQGPAFTEVVVGTPVPVGPKAYVGPDAAFTWQAGVADDHYDVWVDDITTGQSQVLRNQNVLGTSWQPSSLLKDGDSYRWWVHAFNRSGASGLWSAAVDFTVAAFPPPSLLSAGGPAAAPKFTWTAVVNADHYDLWVDDIINGQSQVLRATHVIGTSLISSPLTQGHSYHWWVRAIDSTGNASLWSDFSALTIT